MSIHYRIAQNIKNPLRIKSREHAPAVLRALAAEVERLDWVVACEPRSASGSLVITTSDCPRFGELNVALEQGYRTCRRPNAQFPAPAKRDDPVRRYEPAEEHVSGSVLAATGMVLLAVWILRLRPEAERFRINKGIFNIA